jgi:nucleoside-diphosphate-sugar epimerase
MKVLVAGSTGLAGSAILSFLESTGADVIGVNSKILNLLDREYF